MWNYQRVINIISNYSYMHTQWQPFADLAAIIASVWEDREARMSRKLPSDFASFSGWKRERVVAKSRLPWQRLVAVMMVGTCLVVLSLTWWEHLQEILNYFMAILPVGFLQSSPTKPIHWLTIFGGFLKWGLPSGELTWQWKMAIEIVFFSHKKWWFSIAKC